MGAEIVGYSFQQLIEMETKEVFRCNNFLVMMVNHVNAGILDLLPITLFKEFMLTKF